MSRETKPKRETQPAGADCPADFKRQATLRLARIADQLPAGLCNEIADAWEKALEHIPHLQMGTNHNALNKPLQVCAIVAMLAVLDTYQLEAIRKAIIAAILDDTLSSKDASALALISLGTSEGAYNARLPHMRAAAQLLCKMRTSRLRNLVKQLQGEAVSR